MCAKSHTGTLLSCSLFNERICDGVESVGIFSVVREARISPHRNPAMAWRLPNVKDGEIASTVVGGDQIMYASTQHQPVTYASLFRTFARLGGILVMGFWAVMVVADLIFEGPPSPEMYVQGAALAVVFAGYVAGWWKEVLGAALAIGGTLLLYTVCFRMQAYMPLEGLWLAAPGMFYALAHFADKKHAAQC